MVQVAQSSGVSFALRRIAAPAIGHRIARTVQSTAAEALLLDLRAYTGQKGGACSKAHSRTIAAAAVAPGGQVGIDLEYRDPGRDIGAIAAWIAGRPLADEAAAYRVFTFREAYFKAFGAFPGRALMLDVAAAGSHASAALGVRFETVEYCFVLALVWTGGGAPERLQL